jgi:hypothetical protein
MKPAWPPPRSNRASLLQRAPEFIPVNDAAAHGASINAR